MSVEGQGGGVDFLNIVRPKGVVCCITCIRRSGRKVASFDTSDLLPPRRDRYHIVHNDSRGHRHLKSIKATARTSSEPSITVHIA